MCFEKWRILKLRKRKRNGEGKSAAWLVKDLSLETCFQNIVVFFTSSYIFFLFNACTITILKYVTIKWNKNVFNNFQTNLSTNGNYKCWINCLNLHISCNLSDEKDTNEKDILKENRQLDWFKTCLQRLVSKTQLCFSLHHESFVVNACTITILKYITLYTSINVLINFKTKLSFNSNYKCWSNWLNSHIFWKISHGYYKYTFSFYI